MFRTFGGGPILVCVAQTGLFYPLDLAWTRLAADTAARNEPRRYTSLLHCISQTYHYERLRGDASPLHPRQQGVCPLLLPGLPESWTLCKNP